MMSLTQISSPADSTEEAMCLALPDNVPAVLFPGIHGRSIEVLALANALLQLSPQRPVYIYQDEIYENADAQPSLLDHAKTVASKINKLMAMSFMPITFIAYSGGCILATEVAKLLDEKRAIPTALILIDGASIEATKVYYRDQLMMATRSLIEIINAAAAMSGLKTITLDSHQIEKLSTKVNPVRKLADLHNMVLTHNFASAPAPSQSQLNAYQSTYRVLAQNITHVWNTPSTLKAKPKKLPTIYTFLTDETKQKISGNFGGWMHHAEKVNMINSPSLASQPHLALLNGDNTAPLAHIITDLIKRELPSERLSEIQIDAITRMKKQAKAAAFASGKTVSSSESEEEIYSCSPSSSSSLEADECDESTPDQAQPTTPLIQITKVPGTLFSKPKSMQPSIWPPIHRSSSPTLLNRSDG